MKHKLITFGLIGIINTMVDISLFFMLHSQLLWPVIIANFVSTSAALMISFMLNSQFTFQSHDHKSRRLSRYLIVTLAGLWLLQPLLISVLIGLQNVTNYVSIIHALTGAPSSTLAILIPKVISLSATMAWNYTLYTKYVFRSVT